MIYFIRCGEFVKIGRSEDVAERISSLQTGNPYKVELIGSFDGSDAEERRLHAAFGPFHHRDEWFFFTKTIQEFVNRHCKGSVSVRRKIDLGTGTPPDAVEFVGECLEESPGSFVPNPVMWDAWVRFCGQRSAPTGSKKAIQAKLKKHATYEINNNRPRYVGIRLRDLRRVA